MLLPMQNLRRLFRYVRPYWLTMVVATLVQAAFQFDGVATIGSAFGDIPRELPKFGWLDISVSDVARLVGPAFTIALLGAIESLLSAVVADGMAGTRHDPNQELVGQGVANIVVPLFGGFAATGAGQHGFHRARRQIAAATVGGAVHHQHMTAAGFGDEAHAHRGHPVDSAFHARGRAP